MADVLDVPWLEAQKDAPLVRNLSIETFLYVKLSYKIPEVAVPPSDLGE